MRILLVEDQPDIVEVLTRGLEELRFYVVSAANGSDALALALERSFAVIILDIMLPGLDGLSVCRELRDRGLATPILMLTARTTVPDRVRGLELGADDYLCKPFDFSELVARVRALIRRDRLHKGSVIRVADLVVDADARVAARAGRRLELTEREFTLLEALAGRQGRVLTRDEILERVWMDDESVSNTVDVHIKNLRKQVDAGFSPKLIHTVYGRGYKLDLPDGAP